MKINSAGDSIIVQILKAVSRQPQYMGVDVGDAFFSHMVSRSTQLPPRCAGLEVDSSHRADAGRARPVALSPGPGTLTDVRVSPNSLHQVRDVDVSWPLSALRQQRRRAVRCHPNTW